MSKKMQALFKKKMEVIVREKGATITDDPDYYKWELLTKAGRLRITVHDDSDKIFWVFMKFDEPTKAVDYFKAHYLDIENLNQYSGKYNHYHDDMDFLLDGIKNRLNKLT